MLFNLNSNSGNKLGAKEIRFNEEVLDAKTIATRFAMKDEQIKKYGVEIAKVNDINGMLMSTQALGDKIAATIRSGSNLTSLNFKKLVNEEGKLGSNAVTVALMSADLYDNCFDWEARAINMKNAATIVAGRKGMEMPVVYTPQDIQRSSNKYGVVRDVMTVNDYYLKLCKDFLNSINEDTTLEELENFQQAFEFPTRGLGEQTIDVCKHVDYKFIVEMNDLISPYVTVLGGVKKFESNIDEARKKNSEELYTITAPEPRNNTVRLDDCIGDMKQVCVDVMESTVRDYINALSNNNYDSYKEYENIVIDNKELELVYLIDKVEDSILIMDEDTRERCLYAIYRKADELDIDRERVIKLAIKLAISQVRQTKRGQALVSVLGTSSERKADLWKVATLFSDIFVAEYAGDNTLEIEVDYETSVDIPVDTVIDIENGYGLDGNLYVFGPYENGKVKVVEKNGIYKLVALYNPLEVLMNKYEGTDTIIIPVKSYNKENAKFSEAEKSDPEDIEAGVSFGYNSIANNDLGRLLRYNKKLYLFGIKEDNKQAFAAAKCDEAFNYAAECINLTNTIPFKGFVLADVIK